MPFIGLSPLPAGTLLEPYAQGGAYTDCYAAVLSRPVSHAEFVEAFYTTALFKLERWILATLLARPSTDKQARELASGSSSTFAAWSVEARAPNQVLLAAGRTRSWLMTVSPPEHASTSTRLYFGSAVVPRRGSTKLGWQFTALLGFHKAYSRLLLWAAKNQLSKRRAAGAA
jgi:hypothetical protein